MKIERDIFKKLSDWKIKQDRKPLILQGARQTGKTWLMKTFGERCFTHTAYFNFDRHDELHNVFEGTKDVERLISKLAFFTKVPIEPQKTLIIFDEIQECNKALNCLKYFYEDAPEYTVIAAGSLLGVSMSKGDSFPVGKVDFTRIYPLTFKEFLAADSFELFDFVEKIDSFEEIPLIIFNRLTESYHRYQVTGGMPEAVSNFLDNRGMEKTEEDLQTVLNAYQLDFSKHAENKDIPKITAIWNSIPAQLSRENRKFIYKLVKTNARAREYEDALLWLEQAGLIYRIFANTKPFLPLPAYDDVTAFKIYLSDIGLLRRLAKLSPEIVISGSPFYTEFRGATSENAVLQSLVTQFETLPRYWSSEGKAEIDFLIQHKTVIIPIEVKSGINVTGKSLYFYNEKFLPELRLRYSLNNLKKKDNLLDIPLFLVDWTKKFIDFA